MCVVFESVFSRNLDVPSALKNLYSNSKPRSSLAPFSHQGCSLHADARLSHALWPPARPHASSPSHLSQTMDGIIVGSQSVALVTAAPVIE